MISQSIDLDHFIGNNVGFFENKNDSNTEDTEEPFIFKIYHEHLEMNHLSTASLRYFDP